MGFILLLLLLLLLLYVSPFFSFYLVWIISMPLSSAARSARRPEMMNLIENFPHFFFFFFHIDQQGREGKTAPWTILHLSGLSSDQYSCIFHSPSISFFFIMAAAVASPGCEISPRLFEADDDKTRLGIKDENRWGYKSDFHDWKKRTRDQNPLHKK